MMYNPPLTSLPSKIRAGLVGGLHREAMEPPLGSFSHAAVVAHLPDLARPDSVYVLHETVDFSIG